MATLGASTITTLKHCDIREIPTWFQHDQCMQDLAQLLGRQSDLEMIYLNNGSMPAHSVSANIGALYQSSSTRTLNQISFVECDWDFEGAYQNLALLVSVTHNLETMWIYNQLQPEKITVDIKYADQGRGRVSIIPNKNNKKINEKKPNMFQKFMKK